jgi:hypothetical protein
MTLAIMKADHIARAPHLPLIQSSNEMIGGGGEWAQTPYERPMD